MTTNSTRSQSGDRLKTENLAPSDLLVLENKSPAFKRYYQLLQTEGKTAEDKLRLERNAIWCQMLVDIYINRLNAKDVCRNWSQEADLIIRKAWRLADLDKEPIALFALGKLGAMELNLSSDIDIVAISGGALSQQAESNFRKFISILQNITEYGFCFRVDLDLRPGGRFSKLITSYPAAEDHYWYRGETWERLALVRSRSLLGPPELIADIQNLFRKYTYRKFIDYSLLQDLEGLRSKIFYFRDQTSDGRLHLKLADGGIRDVELFINALQVIHGGRQPKLQVCETSVAIDCLVEAKVFEVDDLLFLKSHYWNLRDIENQVQSINDNQVHSIEQINLEKICPRAMADFEKAQSIVSRLIGHIDKQTDLPDSPDEQRTFLSELGFKSESDWKTWINILEMTARSSRLQHDEAARKKCLFLFTKSLSKGLNPSLGLKYLADFLKVTRAKSSFFSLLLHAPGLIRDLSNLFSCSPFLSQIFVARPELLDSFILNLTETTDNENHSDWPEYLDSLVEEKLLTQIRLSMQLLEHRDFSKLEFNMSELADRITSGLLNRLLIENEAKDLFLLRLGKWAGQEMGLSSDLDFFLLAKEKPNPAQTKVARRFVSRLTEAHKGGALFGVDLRLRPTGSAGPLIIGAQDFLEYVKNSAPAWERQSYYRSRSNSDFDSKLIDIILQKGFSKDDLLELKRIRTELYKQATSGLDIKYSPGGLIDFEFAVQISCIQNKICSTANTKEMLKKLSQASPLWKTKQNLLSENYDFLRNCEQLQKVLGGFSNIGDVETLAQNVKDRMLKSHEALKNLDPALGAE